MLFEISNDEFKCGHDNEVRVGDGKLSTFRGLKNDPYTYTVSGGNGRVFLTIFFHGCFELLMSPIKAIFKLDLTFDIRCS